MLKVAPAFKITAFHSGWNTRFSKNFIFTGESHDFWEFLYVVDGKAGVSKNEKIYELESGEIIFYKPMEFHSVWTIEEPPPRIVILSFTLEGSGFSSLGDGVFKIKKEEHSLIMQASDFYRSAKETADPFSIQLAANHVEELLIRLITSQTPAQTYRITTGAKNYRQIISFLDSHLKDNLSTQDIAKECCFSVSNLKKVFKKYSGMGIMQYYNEQRMILATSYIKQDIKFSEIAEKLNFSSQNYFTEVFKRHMKMTPMQYKKLIEKENNKKQAVKGSLLVKQ